MAIEIGNQGTVVASTAITVDSAKPYFNFTFKQQYASPNVTITSIGGFTSDPAFTPTSNVFEFNSIGTPVGTVTFTFTATSGGITTILAADITQNGFFLQTQEADIASGYTFTFPPITAGVGDIIQIRTYFAD
jgi:hypothetical protein